MKEFDFINKYLKSFSNKNSVNLEDDIAFIDENTVVSTDTSVENVHFLEDMDASDIAYRSCVTAISDLASKAAIPKDMILNLSIKKNTNDEWLLNFKKGLAAVCKEFSLNLLGGDTTISPTLSISVTVIGKIDNFKSFPLRKNAKVNDFIYLIGVLGKSTFGFLSIKGKENFKELEKFYYRPVIDIKTPIKIKEYMNSAIDISDGLVSDAGHMAICSKVKIEIDSKKLPIHISIKNTKCTKLEMLEYILNGGDDYTTLFSSSTVDLDKKYKNITKIGIVKKGLGVRILNVFNSHKLNIKGYEHKW